MARKNRRKNTINKKIKKFTPKMQANLLLVFCVVIIALIVIIGKLVHINRNDGDKYAKRVLAQQTYTSSEIPYKRGTIYDSKGTVLAFSDKAYNLVLDVKYMNSGKDGEFVEPTITALVDSFDFLSREELEKIATERANDQYVILAKELSYDEMIKLEEQVEKEKEKNKDGKSKVRGAWFEEIFIRSYPRDTLVSSIIGFTTNDGNGNWGLEQYYNEELNGTNGVSYGYMDNELNLKPVVEPPTNGNSLVSTIDGDIQRIVQNYINSFKEEYGSENVGIILMDPDNGEIIAMASNEEYDLNNPADLKPFLEEETINNMTEEERLEYLNGIWRNYAISDSFEPGSTFKPFTIAAALDEGLIRSDQTFYCDGGEYVGGWYIRCHKRLGHGTITLSEVLSNSCNDALMQIAELLGRDIFYDYHTFFSFGEKTGIDIPGEAEGLILAEENLNASELATSSFGQTFTTTMLQMTAGYSSLVNGGNYYRPHLVKKILNDDGETIKEIQPEILKKTASRKTSDFLNSALHLTVEEGTAKAAQIEGYEVAGKTGTAQKQPRSAGTYLVSFIGHAPAYDPEVVIFVVIDELQNTNQTNTSVATKMAGDILAEILPFLEVYPDKSLIDSEEIESEPDAQVDGNTDNEITTESPDNNQAENAEEDGFDVIPESQEESAEENSTE